jgi:CheY-like chemotaxis protein
MNVLIVEDQHYPLDALTMAVKKVLPKYDSGFSSDNLHVAKNYLAAKERINANVYDLVLLDHRMPCDDVGDLEEKNFDEFCAMLDNLGYGLIPDIRRSSPSSLIIGTSSLSDNEIGRFERPQYKMSKMYGDAEEDLEQILSEVRK